MKIVTIVGARPQFVKAAVVSRVIRETNFIEGQQIKEFIVHTGQHYDKNMSEIFFEELDIPRPTCNLGIDSCSHGLMTGRMLEGIEPILQELKPDWILIYGDTNSTLAGALAAKKLGLRLAHVEAGLRSFNLSMAEEQNRLLADRLSDILFCPTQTAVANLKNEGIGASPYGERVFNVGDVMYDALLFYSDIAVQKSLVLKKMDLQAREYVLTTIHRAENTDMPDRLQNIMIALQKIAKHTAVVLPIHPRTRKILTNWEAPVSGIKIIDPVSYLDMIMLEKNCQAIITDSGGIQKEAYFFHKPCITLRDETEWVETVNAGTNFVVGTDKNKIVTAFKSLQKMTLDFSQSFYGDGKAGQNIVKILINQ
jgi:UDP-GlcNAc3NAcA epimerase